jgi:hypothetical protein
VANVTIMRQVLIVLGIAAAIGVPAATANHVPNGIYRGTHSGGGTVEMRLNANGDLTLFGADGLKLGGTCPSSSGVGIPAGFPIVNHTLDLIGSSFSVSATFPTPTTATGTFQLSCSPTTLSWTARLVGTGSGTTPAPARPAAPKSRFAPGFRGGGSVKLARIAGVASIRAVFRACEGTPPFRLVVRQRRKTGSSFVADTRFTLKLPAGKPAKVPDGAPCRDFSVTWRLAPRFFGGGLLVITLKLVDADGRASGIPGWLVRSPLK